MGKGRYTGNKLEEVYFKERERDRETETETERERTKINEK